MIRVKLALESLNIEKDFVVANPTDNVVSVDIDMLDLLESEQKLISIENFLSAAESLSVKDNAISSLEDILSTGGNFNPTLIKTIYSAVSNGTDYTFSTESLKEGLIRLYQKILEVLVSAWDNLLLHLDSTYLQTTVLLNRVGSLKKMTEERVPGVPSKATIELNSNMAMWENKTLDTNEYLSKVRELPSVIDNILVDHVVKVINISKHLTPLMSSVLKVDTASEKGLELVKQEAKSIAKLGNEIVESMLSLGGSDVTGERSNAPVNSSINKVKKVKSVLGNKSIYCRYGAVDKAAIRGEGQSFFNALQVVFSASLTLEDSKLDVPPVKNYLVPILSLNDVNELADSLEEILLGIRSFKLRSGKEISTLRTAYQRMRAAASSLSKSGDSSEINLYLRKLAMAATGMAKWTYHPFIPLTNLSLRVTRTALQYAESSVTKYPVK